MNYQDLIARFGASDRPTRAALIGGAGQFGRTLLGQARRIPALDLAVLCDRDIERLEAACRAAGLSDDAFAIVESRGAALEQREAGRTVLTASAELAVRIPVDVVVEATGHAESGAANALRAIDQGCHVVLVTKETDSVVGPELSYRARRAGLVVSQVDGDQPSLLLGLLSWARALGLRISCAGKASEYDFVFDPASGRVSSQGLEIGMEIDGALWDAGTGDLAALVAERAAAMQAIPQHTPPDYCEMCLVANASGLKPDIAEMHAPIARTSELPTLFQPAIRGGLLAGGDRLDIFNCFRRPDEASFAGGVFVVFEAPDRETGQLFRAKGMPATEDGQYVLAYNPTHLLGAEAPLSILVPHRLGLATGAADVSPVCDVVMRASRDLPAGTTFASSGSHHRIDGVDALIVDYAPLRPGVALPYYLGDGLRLRRDVPAGTAITVDDVLAPTDSVLWTLRRDQDTRIESELGTNT